MFKIRIRTQIIGGFLSISLLIVMLSLFSILSTKQSLNALETLKDEVLLHTMRFIELDRNIIQIQQWLTDVSATRGAEGFDDGYSEAYNYYKEAASVINVLIKDHTDEPAMLESLKKN